MGSFLVFLLAVGWLLYQLVSKKPCPPNRTFDWEKSSEELRNGLDAKEWNRRVDKGYYWSSKEEVNDKKRTRELNEFCKNRLYECKHIYFTDYQYMWDTYKKQFKNNRDSKGNLLPLDEEARLILSMFEKNCLKNFHIQKEKYQRELEKLKTNHSDEAAIERIRKEKWLAYYEQGIKDLYKELGITAKDDPNIKKPIEDKQPTMATVSFPKENQAMLSRSKYEQINIKESTFLERQFNPILNRSGYTECTLKEQNDLWSLNAIKDGRRYVFSMKIPLYHSNYKFIPVSAFSYCIEALCQLDVNSIGKSFYQSLQRSLKRNDINLEYARNWCDSSTIDDNDSFRAHILKGTLWYINNHYNFKLYVEITDNEEYTPFEFCKVSCLDEKSSEVLDKNKNNSLTDLINQSTLNKPSDSILFDSMDGHEFENFCADILRKNGYIDVQVTRGSGDQGVDIIAYKDDVKYGIQCKCYSSDVGNKAVQEVFSGKAFYNCHVGVVLTNSYFTNAAIQLAKNTGIVLWDRDKLLKMIDSANS